MKTLIAVDVQHDFLPGGALAVPEGDEVLPFIERIAPDYDLIIPTRDWHPANHSSFEKYGGIWPSHCVQGTRGAEIHPDISALVNGPVISKGTSRLVEAYSGFAGRGDIGQGRLRPLHDILQRRNVDAVDIVGLATEYCVKATALDAQKLGYKTTVLLDGARGVTVYDAERAINDLIRAGVRVTTVDGDVSLS